LGALVSDGSALDTRHRGDHTIRGSLALGVRFSAVPPTPTSTTLKQHLPQLRPPVEPVVTRCARCGRSWAGTPKQMRAAFREHACG
jgi:hypothetical protein